MAKVRSAQKVLVVEVRADSGSTSEVTAAPMQQAHRTVMHYACVLAP
jgi:hypothetical protein